MGSIHLIVWIIIFITGIIIRREVVLYNVGIEVEIHLDWIARIVVFVEILHISVHL